LIVDDNATNRKILHHQLSQWKMPNEEAASGVEALVVLQRAARAGHPFQLAILDMQMAGMDGWMLAKAIKADPRIAGTRLVMMTSLDRREDAAAMSAAGLDAYLTKPVKHAQLCESLSKVMGSQPGLRSDQGAMKPAQATGAQSANGMRVLIAEDNIVNQKVAVTQVRKLGCHADVVGNGREALDALEAAEYDLVLMDCQMPELDGYEATARLRVIEGEGRHTHVVAMTAHAIEGDREKFLAAGMDDYLSKPVRFEELSAVVKQIQLRRGSQEPAIATESVEALRELCADGEGDILTELIDTYLENTPQLVEQAAESLSRREANGLALAAHTLKGSSSNFGAKPLQELAAELETLARSADFQTCVSPGTRATELLDAIRREYERVSAALGEYRGKP
jgi:CheY-like chemotaxis protein